MLRFARNDTPMAQATARPAIFQTRFKTHPSLRYKTVQALKHEDPPVKEISITMRVRITLQEFDDHIYLRNIGGHEILP